MNYFRAAVYFLVGLGFAIGSAIDSIPDENYSDAQLFIGRVIVWPVVVGIVLADMHKKETP